MATTITYPEHRIISIAILIVHLLGLNTNFKTSTYNLLVPLIVPGIISVMILSPVFSAVVSLLSGFILDYVESWDEGIAIFRESFVSIIGIKLSRSDG